MPELDAAMTAIANSVAQGYLLGIGFVVFVALLRTGGR